MAKQLGGTDVTVNLGFTADTTQAKAQLQDLQKMLTNLINKPTNELGVSKELREASVAAATLKTQLHEATDVNTGKLDLGKFNQSLTQSGYKINDYKNALMALGPQGQKAFSTLAQSITTAEVPLKRSSVLLEKFGNTLKNTIRWQFSSSMLHGFMGSIQSAYGYAQDLNESLNNIRIVTGQSSEQMADFARQANESAKALSTTTTAYTDAALIFYQQGLSGEDVKERTDTVMKMSNVTGDAVEDVSSYMTAIWNNFDDGSQSLEHYADVITALGASTASSSAEIAAGLEKFASVGETVGLSYDYATASLATVVAETRQSEDVVGTAFKTIFARLQGLELGETAEDGTDLNKYSAALEKVGITIKDQNGQLKDMDIILDELGAKWQTLGRDQQTALAQTVAGTRQYTQLVSLMENWDKVKENIQVAQGSEGALQEQADIYAESWDAASKRVKAAWQDIYDSILNDEFFIKINNGFATILEGVDKTIDGLGGFKGVLLAIGTLFTTLFKTQIADSIDRVIYNFKMMTGTGQKAIADLRNETNKSLVNMFSGKTNNPIDNRVGQAYASQARVQQTFLDKTKELTVEQQKIAQILLDQHNTLVQNVAEQAKITKKAEENANARRRDLTTTESIRNATKARKEANQGKTNKPTEFTSIVGLNNGENNKISFKSDNVRRQVQEFQTMAKQAQTFRTIVEGAFSSGEVSAQEYNEKIIAIATTFKDLDEMTKAFGKDGVKAFDDFQKEILEAGEDTAKIEAAIDRLWNAMGNKEGKVEKAQNILTDEVMLDPEKIDAVSDSAEQAGKELGELTLRTSEVNANSENMNKTLNNIPQMINKGAQSFANFAQQASMIAMGINSVVGAVRTLFNEDLSFPEKLLQITLSLGTAIPILVSAFDAEAIARTADAIATKALTAANVELQLSSGALLAILGALVVVIGVVGVALDKMIITSKEAAANFKKSSEEFESCVGELNSLKSELEQTSERIDELKNKGTLSFVEKSELEKLEHSKNLLERQIELKEREAAIDAKKKAKDAEEKITNWTVQDYSLRNYAENPDTIDNLQKNINSHKKLYREDAKYFSGHFDNLPSAKKANDFTDINEALATYEFTAERLEDELGEKQRERYETLNELSDEYIQNQIQGINDVITSLQEMKEYDPDNFGEKEQEKLDNYIKLQDKLLYQLDPEKQNTLRFEDIVDSESFKKGFEEINLEKEKIKDENDLKEAFGDNFNSLKKEINESGLTMDAFINEFNARLDEAATQLSRLGLADAVNRFNEINELKNDLSEDLTIEEETFAKLQPEVQEYFTYMADGTYRLTTDAQTFYDTLDNISIQNFVNTMGNLQAAIGDGRYESFDELSVSAGYAEGQRGPGSPGEFNTQLALDQAEYVRRFSEDVDSSQVDEWIDKINEGGPEAIETAGKLREEVEKIGATDFENSIQELDRLSQALESAMDPLDEDVDAEQFNSLANMIKEAGSSLEGFSDEIRENAYAAEDAAEAILRFDSACEDVQENFEDWMDVLSNSGDNMQDIAAIMGDLQDAYGDLLDIDGSALSTDFLKSAENLELMKAAIDGDIDAYNQLKDLAAEDIVTNILVNTNGLYDMQSEYNYIRDNIQDIEVGATIDDTKFLEACNAIVYAAQAAGIDAQDALMAMGIDAELEADTSRTVDTKTAVGWEARTDYVPLKGSVPNVTTSTEGGVSVGENIPLTGAFPVVSVQPKPVQEEEPKEMTGYALKVKSATKAAGGNVKFNHSSHGGGSAGRSARSSGGGGGGRSGGSGGGSSTPKQPKTKDHKKPIKDVADRYHDLKQAVADVEHEMTKLAKVQDHLTGANLIKSLQKQNELLKKQSKNYKAINEEIKREQQELREKLGAYGGGVNYNTDDGSLNNYFAIFNGIKDEYNAAVEAYNQVMDQYNAMSAEEQEATGDAITENAEKALEAAKERYDEAKGYLDRYDETVKEFIANDEKLQELMYQQIENNLKAFELKVQLTLDIRDAERKVNNFINEINQNFKKVRKTTDEWLKSFDVGLKNAQSYIGSGGTITTRLNEIKQVQDIVNNPNYNYNSENSLFGSREEALTKLQEYTDELMSEGKELYELYKDAWEEYLDAIDQVVDQWNDIISEFNEINDTLDHYEKVIELLYGGSESAMGRDYLASMYEASANNSIAKQATLRDEIKALEKEYQELLAAGAKENDKDVQEIKEAIEDANKNLQSEIENYIDTIQNQLINSIQSILDIANRKMTKGYGIDKVIERWDKAKQAAEGYYDEVERVYQIDRIQGLWEDTINNTSSLKNQQYLKTIMDSQLENLRSKTKLSEYNIGLAEKELAIAQAQMALEDARNNKNTMKLTRNEIGDWTYNYVADEDEVDAKEQDLLNATYDKYEYVKQSSSEATEALLGLYQEANEKLSELMEQYKYADEERRKTLQEEYDYWWDYYYGEDGVIIQKATETQEMETDLNIAGMETLWDLYELNSENYKIMTDNEKALIDELVNHGIDSFRSLTEQVATDDGSFYKQIEEVCREVIKDNQDQWTNLAKEVIANWATNPDSVRAMMQDAYKKIREAVDAYDKRIAQSEQASGIAWSNITQGIDAATNATERTRQKVAELINQSNQLSVFRNAVLQIESAWNSVKTSIENATRSLVSYANQLTQVAQAEIQARNAAIQRAQAEAQAAQVISAAKAIGSSLANSLSGGGGGGDSTSGSGGGPSGSSNNPGPLNTANEYTNSGLRTQDYEKNEIRRSKNRSSTSGGGGDGSHSFDTGGYTGDWNDSKEGKIGILHSKELVLNKEDTKNILDAVSVVRSIDKVMNNIIAGVSNIKPGTVNNTGNETNTTNEFNITAEFPNANNVTEIQEAILSLPTLASQYIDANK